MTSQKTTWKIDTANSELRFTVSHLVISRTSGRFGRWGGTIRLDQEDIRKSSVEILIESASVDTGNVERDTHLRSPEFLDTDQSSGIRFRSVEIVPAGGGDYLIKGELTIREQTHPMTMFVEDKGRVRDAAGQTHAAFFAHGAFNRQDFGIRWHNTIDAGALLVGDQVEVHVEAEAVEVRGEHDGVTSGGPPTA